jgi:hypothetical protein
MTHEFRIQNMTLDGEEGPPRIYDDVESAVETLPEFMKPLAREFPPGSHFHLADGEVFWLWGYGQDGTELVISTVQPTPETVQDPALNSKMKALKIDDMRKRGIVPCGRFLSGYAEEGDDNITPDWALIP